MAEQNCTKYNHYVTAGFAQTLLHGRLLAQKGCTGQHQRIVTKTIAIKAVVNEFYNLLKINILN